MRGLVWAVASIGFACATFVGVSVDFVAAVAWLAEHRVAHRLPEGDRASQTFRAALRGLMRQAAL